MTEKDNSGFLFKNTRKEKPTHKDYEGNCVIHGRSYWMSAWVKESDKVGKFLSISFEEKIDVPEL